MTTEAPPKWRQILGKSEAVKLENGFVAHVYPMSFQQIEEAVDVAGQVLASVASDVDVGALDDKGTSDKDWMARDGAKILAVLPRGLRDLRPVLDRCVVIAEGAGQSIEDAAALGYDVGQLTLADLGLVIDAWWKLTTEGNLSAAWGGLLQRLKGLPIVEKLDRMLKKAGSAVSSSNSSTPASKPGTAAATSSTSASPASLTRDGASRS